MNDNKIATLLKLDEDSKDSISKNKNSNSEISKSKIRSICKKFCVNTDEYNPDESLPMIRDYLKSNGKLERILYSEISSFYYGLKEIDRGVVETNVEKLLSFSLEQETETDVKKIVVKIYDHINLASCQVNNIKNMLSLEVDEAMSEVRKRTKEAQNMQKEYITILGIFAAIVLAFVGGMTFSTSVLQNINAVSIYRLLTVIDLLAFVLCNTIYILLKFVMNINGKKSNGIYIKYLNLCLLTFAMIIVIAWFVNCKSLVSYINTIFPWNK